MRIRINLQNISRLNLYLQTNTPAVSKLWFRNCGRYRFELLK